MNPKEWRTLRKTAIASAKVAYSALDARWALAEELHISASEAFVQAASAWTRRPLVERAGRAFDWLHARFVAVAEPALVAAHAAGTLEGPRRIGPIDRDEFDNNDDIALPPVARRSRMVLQDAGGEALVEDFELSTSGPATAAAAESAKAAVAVTSSQDAPPLSPPRVAAIAALSAPTPASVSVMKQSIDHASLVALVCAPPSRAEEVAEEVADIASLRALVSDTLTHQAALALDALLELDRTAAAGGVPAAGFVRALSQLFSLDSVTRDCTEGLTAAISRALKGSGGNVAHVAAPGSASSAATALATRVFSASFILADVPCSACAAVRDVDVARDDVGGGGGGAGSLWLCPCGAAYDPRALEALLVAALEHASMAFQAQDLRCSRCKATRASAVRGMCECSGAYELGVPPDAFKVVADTFRRIADRCGCFDWLAATAKMLSNDCA